MVSDVLRLVAAATRTEKASMPVEARQRLEIWITALFLLGLVLIGSALPYL